MRSGPIFRWTRRAQGAHSLVYGRKSPAYRGFEGRISLGIASPPTTEACIRMLWSARRFFSSDKRRNFLSDWRPPGEGLTMAGWRTRNLQHRLEGVFSGVGGNRRSFPIHQVHSGREVRYAYRSTAGSNGHPGILPISATGRFSSLPRQRLFLRSRTVLRATGA